MAENQCTTGTRNNFQPRIAVAWSPNYSGGLLHSLFGDSGKSVLRGGFALTNDYYGQALAVDWDLNNTLGFTSNYTTPANTYDTVASNLAPLFTGFNQDVRSLPKVVCAGQSAIPPVGIGPTKPNASRRGGGFKSYCSHRVTLESDVRASDARRYYLIRLLYRTDGTQSASSPGRHGLQQCS